MSSDSAVTYTSVHSEARSWSIPSEDPYEEVARQLLEQAPCPSEYVPNPMELEDHVPVRATTPSIYHSLLPAGMPPLLPIPLPVPSGTPPLHLLSTDRREDRPEVTLPPRKRLGIALGPAYEVEESSSAAVARPAGGLRADYGFVATMYMEISRDPERDVGYGITGSWDEIVETLDRRAHARTARLMETKARMSREAWGRSMDATDRRRQTVITEMLAADHRRQKQLTEALKLIKRLQTQMAKFERQQGPTKGPVQPELPEEAGSSS
ncbi:hypothetical protein Tco_0132103 [Tanacetum coccineum]